MNVKRVGIVGWRGMVGSVLINRMIEEKDFDDISDVVFFSTSQAGKDGPNFGKGSSILQDATNIADLKKMDAILTCQGSDYTKKIFKELKSSGWNGYWIDAASNLRMEKSSTIILDPINKNIILDALKNGKKEFIGGNCTISCMLMGIGGLFKENLIEWATSMTYQAASGGGAQHMKELLTQMGILNNSVKNLLKDPSSRILEIDKLVHSEMSAKTFPSNSFEVPLAGSLIPWIDVKLDNGQSKEEWKAFAETNKILGNEDKPIPIDGTCVRIGSMRSHSAALTIKLRKNISINEIENIIKQTSEWTQIVKNEKISTIKELSPASVSGTLKVPVGRIRKLNIGQDYLNVFTVGDQLLWGAAEPLRRMLKIVLHH